MLLFGRSHVGVCFFSLSLLNILPVLHNLAWRNNTTNPTQKVLVLVEPCSHSCTFLHILVHSCTFLQETTPRCGANASARFGSSILTLWNPPDPSDPFHHLPSLRQISDKVPFVADLKPSGKYVMEDLQGVGGIPAVLKMLMEEGLVDGSCMTVTGK